MFLFVALAYGLFASYWDLAKGAIPNMLTLAFLAIALAASFVQNVLRFEYLAFLTAFSLVLYALGAWAGGDAKLFIAINAYLPLLRPVAPLDFVYAFLFAALFFAPLYLMMRFSKDAKLKSQQFPFAPFITAGFIAGVVLV